MRIAHVITRFIRGGADENTLLSCNGQAELGHDVSLIYGAETSDAMLARLDRRISAIQIKSLVRPISPARDLAALVAMRKLFKDLRPEIVHTHTSKAGILGRLAAKASNVPGVVHGVHILPFLNVGPWERLIFLGAEKALAPVTNAFVNVSEGMQLTGIRNGVGNRKNHAIVRSGMDVDQFRKAKPLPVEELCSELNIAISDVGKMQLVVMVAALEPRKRVLEFLDAVALVTEQCPNAFLVILGEGPLRAAICAKAIALGVAHRIRLLGFRTDVERWLASADVCVLASEREGLPRAVVQYVLAGKATVCTALPGVELVVKDGESGILVHLGEDIVAFAPPIVQVLRDPSLRKRLALGASQTDLSAWSSARMVSDLEKIYEKVLLGRPVGIHGQLASEY